MTKPPGNQPYQLLAVDDNELNLGLFRLLLTQQGHVVTSVNNPFNAVELVKKQTFDLVFTDIQMPGMTGIEASKRMRENGFRGPIIAITAHLSDLEELEIEASTVNDVLFKPVTKPDLNSVIERWLNDSKEGSSIASQPNTDPQSVIEARTEVEATPAPTKLYDLDIALARANESPELATEMLHLLVQSLLEAMGDLNGKGDPDVLAQRLHKILGGVRFSGATQLEAELEQLRRLMQQGTFTEKNIEALKEKIQDLADWALKHPAPFN